MTPPAARLPPAPSHVTNEDGHPRFGTYMGSIDEVDLSRLAGPYHLSLPQRLLKHKRWLFTFMSTPEVIAVCAISDLTYTANAFTVVVDLKDKKVVADESFMGLPGPWAEVGNRPSEGLRARFRAPGARFGVVRPEGSERVHLGVERTRRLPFSKPSLSWKGDLLAVGGPPPLTVVSPVLQDGVVNVTQKWAGLLAFGELSTQGRRYRLDGGVGGMDYTQGYLARRTSWRWAFANGRLDDGTPIGLNLVEGFNDTPEANENAVWMGKELFPVGRACFAYDPREVLDEWRVATVDGALDLAFRPYGAHREERDYKVVKSYFAQPVGVFEGRIRVGGRELRVSELPGVTEDQDILW
ncbi:MAG: DUF2804 domain-containing protein [Myxococcota bacterium]